MIESILKNAFPTFYGKKTKDLEVPIRRMHAPFSETDTRVVRGVVRCRRENAAVSAMKRFSG